MAVILDATAGGSDSNSYATLAEANSYFEKRLHVSDWTGATNVSRSTALIWATALLDTQIKWNGMIMTTTQALRWPRGAVIDLDGRSITDTDIPQFLKDAASELALHLIISDRTLDDDTKGFKSIKVADISLVMSPSDRKVIIPKSVWEKVKHYGIKVSSDRYLVRM